MPQKLPQASFSECLDSLCSDYALRHPLSGPIVLLQQKALDLAGLPEAAFDPDFQADRFIFATALPHSNRPDRWLAILDKLAAHSMSFAYKPSGASDWLDAASRDLPEARSLARTLFSSQAFLDFAFASSFERSLHRQYIPRLVEHGSLHLWDRLSDIPSTSLLDSTGIAIDKALAKAPSGNPEIELHANTHLRPEYRGGARVVCEAFDQAEQERLGERLGPLGPGWALACLCSLNDDRFRAAIASGVDLSKASPAQAAQAFLRLFSEQSHKGWRVGEKFHYSKSPVGKTELANDKRLGERKAQLWREAIAAGLPRIDASDEFLRGRLEEGHGLWLLRAEAERGGLLGARAARIWSELTSIKEPYLARKEVFGDQEPLAWAIERKLDLSGITPDHIIDASGYGELGTRIDQVLASLAASASTPKFSKKSKTAKSIPHAMSRLLPGKQAWLDAHALGLDLFSRDDEGSNILRGMIDVNRLAPSGPALQNLLDALESIKPGSARSMARQADHRGATPLHWAARALRPDCVKILHAFGADPKAADASGSTVAHWAARRYGAKVKDRAAACIKELQAMGVDWTMPDKAGTTPMAALSRVAPLEIVAELLEHNPAAIEAAGVNSKGKKALPAIAKLASRGAEALSIGERALFKAQGPADGLEKDKPPTKRRL